MCAESWSFVARGGWPKLTVKHYPLTNFDKHRHQLHNLLVGGIEGQSAEGQSRLSVQARALYELGDMYRDYAGAGRDGRYSREMVRAFRTGYALFQAAQGRGVTEERDAEGTSGGSGEITPNAAVAYVQLHVPRAGLSNQIIGLLHGLMLCKVLFVLPLLSLLALCA
jgi:hypothetical protein